MSDSNEQKTQSAASSPAEAKAKRPTPLYDSGLFSPREGASPEPDFSMDPFSPREAATPRKAKEDQPPTKGSTGKPYSSTNM